MRATEPTARGKTRGWKRKERRRAKKTQLYLCEGSPSGREQREIPGVTQVDENGHEGNMAVVTAYTCWEKHGIVFHEE